MIFIFEYILFGGRIFIPEAVAVGGVLNKAIILSLLITLFVYVAVLLSFEDENAFCKSWSKFVVIKLPSVIFVDGVVNISCKGLILSVEETFIELEEADGKGNDGSSKSKIYIYEGTYLGVQAF